MGYRKVSPDVKLAAMKLYEQDILTLNQILDCVSFSERTFWRIWKLYNNTGDVEPPTCTTRGRPRKLHFDDITYLLALVRQRPDWFLDELLHLLDCNRFISVHYTTIHRELERAGISLKKLRIIAKERDEDLRADFIRQMGQYSAEELGFLDEFSKDERTIQRRRGRAKKGKRPVMRGVFVRGRRVSGEGLLTLDGIVASTVVEGSMTREKYLYFLEHSVVSTLSPLDTSLSDMAWFLDATDIALPWTTECSCHGQRTYSSWFRNIRACREVWYVYSILRGFMAKYILQVYESFSYHHTPLTSTRLKKLFQKSRHGFAVIMTFSHQAMDFYSM
jgi:transposase